MDRIGEEENTVKGSERFRELSRLLRWDTEHRDDESGRYDRLSLHWGALFLMLISLLLTGFNIYRHYTAMALSTGLLALGFAAARLMSGMKRLTVSRVIMAVLLAFIFSAYVITGQNEGCASLWILLIPIISMFMLGLRIGFLLSLYFQLLLIALFYTPLSQYVQSYYTHTFLMRYPVLYLTSFVSITYLMFQRRRMLMRLHTQAYHDGMTGLGNRLYCRQLLKELDRPGRCPELTLIDLDINGLKDANDTLGHEAGDELILATAQLLTETFPAENCFRMGGDEFLVVGEDSGIAAALPLFTERMKSWRGSMNDRLSLSIGVASRTEHPDADAQELLRASDRAMYECKACHYRETGRDRRKS